MAARNSDFSNSTESAFLAGRAGWLILPQHDRPGHSISFAGLVLFTLLLVFSPAGLFSRLRSRSINRGGLNGDVVCANANHARRPPNCQTTRIKTALLGLTVLALLSIPLAVHRDDSWQVFTDQFIKIVAMFIVMINVVRTESRWKWLFWVALAAGLQLAGTAINDWRTGQTPLEGYRVAGAQAWYVCRSERHGFVFRVHYADYLCPAAGHTFGMGEIVLRFLHFRSHRRHDFYLFARRFYRLRFHVRGAGLQIRTRAAPINSFAIAAGVCRIYRSWHRAIMPRVWSASPTPVKTQPVQPGRTKDVADALAGSNGALSAFWRRHEQFLLIIPTGANPRTMRLRRFHPNWACPL